MKRREILTGFAAAALGAAFPALAAGEALQVVVPFPPGGGGDTLARAVLEPASAVMKRSIVVLNRPGAGGTVGARAAAKAKADGSTLCYVTNGILCVNAHLYPKLGFDARRELLPVCALSRIGLVMAVNVKAAGCGTLRELLDKARANPGAVAFASAGVGTTSHLAGELLAESAGVRFNHIPHAGGAASVKEVLAGRIPFLIDVMPNVMPHVESGALAAFAVTTPERSPIAPDIPTFAELGLKGVSLFAWDGLAAPLGTPEAALRPFADAVQAALSQKEVAARFRRRGAEPLRLEGRAFADFIDGQAPVWAELARRAAAA
jgi:tripartite-type tricarboxylate transporter receptor subunit TctC